MTIMFDDEKRRLNKPQQCFEVECITSMTIPDSPSGRVKQNLRVNCKAVDPAHGAKNNDEAERIAKAAAEQGNKIFLQNHPEASVKIKKVKVSRRINHG